MINKNINDILDYKKFLKLLILYNSCSKEQKMRILNSFSKEKQILIEKNLKIINNFLKEQIK